MSMLWEHRKSPWDRAFRVAGAVLAAGVLASCGTAGPSVGARPAASAACPAAGLQTGRPGSLTVSGDLYGVAALPSGSVWTVGTTTMTDPLTMHWNGSAWSEDVLTIAKGKPGNPPGDFNAVAAVSASDIWAIGWTAGQPLAEHWDGRAWTVVPTPSAGPPHSGASVDLQGAAAASARDIWAVGGTNDNQTWIIHWDGTAWSRVPSPNPPGGQNARLTAVAAASADDAWAVGSYSGPNDSPKTPWSPLIEHWDGTAWSVVPSAAIPDAAFPVLTGVAVTSPTDAWAVGVYGLIAHWDGRAWTTEPNPDNAIGGTLGGVAALSRDDAWAVGTGAFCPGRGLTTLIEHWDGRAWTVVPSPAAGVLTAVTATSPDSAWAVGSVLPGGGGTAVIEHWDGKTWTWPAVFCAAPSGAGCYPPSTPIPPQ
jgi:hypothetical protein